MCSTAMPMPEGFRVEPHDEAVPKARRRIVAVARGWDLPLPDETFDDLALLSSEVITNAVRHTAAPCAVVVQWTGVRLRVEVIDVGPALPAAPCGDPDAEDGRGLTLMSSMATDWGSAPIVAGKVVWFEVGPATPVPALDRVAA